MTENWTPTRLVPLAASGSFLALAGAFFSEMFLGVDPCHLCILQRYPHWAMLGIGLLTMIVYWRFLPALAVLIALWSTGFALYHSGVERKLWDGPSDCTGGAGDLTGMSGADLLSMNFENNLVMCDEISFSIMGLSFANMNVLLSAVLVVLWILAARRG